MAKYRFSAGVVTGVVIAATLTGTAYAATGGTFLIGRANSSSTQTGLSNSGGGAVLSLSTRSGQAPLAVSSGAGKATNLNADKLDGLDASALALSAGRIGTISSDSVAIDLDEDGVYDARGALAECPAGTKLAGGGYEAFVLGGAVINRATPDGTGWMVITVFHESDADDDVTATAQCYNPRGSVSGAVAQSALVRKNAPELTDDEAARVLRLAG